MDSLLRGAPKFVNGYMDEVLVNVLLILSMDSLLRGAPKLANGYKGEVLVKDAASFINGFFVKRGS